MSVEGDGQQVHLEDEREDASGHGLYEAEDQQVRDGFPQQYPAPIDGRACESFDGVVFEFDRERSAEAEQRREYVGDPEQARCVGAGCGRRAAGQREVEDHDHQHREEQHRDGAVAAAPFGQQVLPEHCE